MGDEREIKIKATAETAEATKKVTDLAGLKEFRRYIADLIVVVGSLDGVMGEADR
jgi:NADH:ubiquinone oxidoreductase subunit D